MELLTLTGADTWLTAALETDPEMMRELGGPVPRREIPRIHARRLAAIARGAWYYKIVPEPGGPAVGTIGIWTTPWNGSRITETGWAVLRDFQRRGYASQALRVLLDRARAEHVFGDIHAFPGVTNEASNAVCRKAGFVLLEECDGDYRGRPLRCNHWVLPAGAT